MRVWLFVVVAGVMLGSSAHAESGLWDRLFGSPASSLSSAPASAPDVPAVPAQPAPADIGATPLSPSVAVPPSVAMASDYKLGPGDHLMITVFNEKDLSIDVRLSDAGTFSYPLLGEVRALGMTTGMLQDFLTQQLKNGFLVSPQVYVSIADYRQFFVNGEVNKPGGLPYQPGLTVRKAIALAGGFTPRASYTKFFVIHEDDPFGQPRPVSLDTFLRPGDILTIEQSFF